MRIYAWAHMSETANTHPESIPEEITIIPTCTLTLCLLMKERIPGRSSECHFAGIR